MAFEGCFEIAEDNIKNDFACSMKQRADKAQADADCFQKSTKKLSDELDKPRFAKEKLVIQKAVSVYQINRHRRLRKTGEAERRPVYNATDWNYIRFDCGPVSYELYNDSLKLV